MKAAIAMSPIMTSVLNVARIRPAAVTASQIARDRAEDCPDDPAHIPIMRRRFWQAAVMPVASAADPCPRQGSRAWRSPPVRADISRPKTTRATGITDRDLTRARAADLLAEGDLPTKSVWQRICGLSVLIWVQLAVRSCSASLRSASAGTSAGLQITDRQGQLPVPPTGVILPVCAVVPGRSATRLLLPVACT